MYLEILTPSNKVYSGNVKLVKVPGSMGSFEVLSNHAPLISTLYKGNIKIITTEDETHQFEVNGGVIQVVKNNIIVLAESLTKI